MDGSGVGVGVDVGVGVTVGVDVAIGIPMFEHAERMVMEMNNQRNRENGTMRFPLPSREHANRKTPRRLRANRRERHRP